MYGVMSFSYYNFYSPRCGTSITGCGRWCLNVSAAVVAGLGFDLVYGDTDSVMYTIDFNDKSNSLLHSYVNYATTICVNVGNTEIMEFISGNVAAMGYRDSHMMPASNIVVKTLNNIMCYTCFVELSVEQQQAGSTIPREYSSVVYPFIRGY